MKLFKISTMKKFCFVLVFLLVFPFITVASDVDFAVIDGETEIDSLTLAPGSSTDITIEMKVTGNQVGDATFKVNTVWTLDNGTFSGSQPEQFSVDPRAAQDDPDVFNVDATIIIAAGEEDEDYILTINAFDITNTNQTGAKLDMGDSAVLTITVESETDNYFFGGFLPPIGRNNAFKAGSTIPVKFQLTDEVGAYFGDAVAKIKLTQKNGSTGTESTAVITVYESADTGGVFRYDEDNDQYIYNLKTAKSMNGTYIISVEFEDITVEDYESAEIVIRK